MLGGTNQTYYPLSETSSMLSPTTNRDSSNSNLTWDKAASYKNASNPRYSSRGTTAPNLQARNLLLQREREEKVFLNLNRASERLERQRALLPPREWFLPDLIPVIKDNTNSTSTNLQLQLHCPNSIDLLIDQFPDPSFSRPSSFLTPLCDDMSALSVSSDSSDSKPRPPSFTPAPKRPVSQPELPAFDFETLPLRRKELDLTRSPSSSRIERRLSPPSFLALLENSTVRLDHQRASLRTTQPSRPLSWGHPSAPSRSPLFTDKEKERRGSLKTAFDRVSKATNLFRKKSLTGSVTSLPPSAPVSSASYFASDVTSSSPSRAPFWQSRRKPTC